MLHHVGYTHGASGEPFSPPACCSEGYRYDEYLYEYQKGYRYLTRGEEFVPPTTREESAA